MEKYLSEINIFVAKNHQAKIVKFNKILLLNCLISGTMFSIFPIIQSAVEYYTHPKADFVYRYPLMFWNPFREQKPLGYASNYLIQVLAIYLSTLSFTGIDLWLLTNIRINNMFLKDLQNRIMGLKPCGELMDVELLKPILKCHKLILG